jgi:hypothetical protein
VGVFEIIREALRIARTHKSLWLFGFLVGLGGGFDFGGGQGQQPTPPAAATPAELQTQLLVVLGVLAVVVVFVVLKFLAAGALIEGVTRARRNGSMSVAEGFREGWASWGVLFRITLLYLPMNVATVALLAAACYVAWLVFGAPTVFLAAAAAILVGVPCLLTLYMWQMFAERIAVLENRRALDAMRKARLFLHGRLPLGLRLFVAGFLGVLFVTALGVLVIAPVAAIVVASAGVWGGFGAAGLGVLTLAPLLFVAVAFVGIMVSSVWTIGYLSQVER